MADVDTELALTTLEPSPKKEKKKKKRNSDAMDVDDEEEEHTSKKVKLSKEEKKALKKASKKAKKDKAKTVPAADGDSVSCSFVVCWAGTDCGVHRTMRFLRKRRRKERKRRKRRNWGAGGEFMQRFLFSVLYLFSLHFPLSILSIIFVIHICEKDSARVVLLSNPAEEKNINCSNKPF